MCTDTDFFRMNDDHVKMLDDGAASWNSAWIEVGSQHIDLSDADLRNRDLRNFRFRKADLTGANLAGADLRRADLVDADLNGANLSGVKLSRADLRNADLRGADFSKNSETGANTDLAYVVNLSQAQLSRTIGDDSVELPDELEFPSHWETDPFSEGASRFERGFRSAYGQGGYLEGPLGTDIELVATGSEPTAGTAIEQVETLSPERLKQVIKNNNLQIYATGNILLYAIGQQREKIRGNNELDEEIRLELLDFIDNIKSDTEKLISYYEFDKKTVSDDEAEDAKSWLDRYWFATSEELRRLFSPESLAQKTVPVGLICAFAAFGTAFGPQGMAAGVWLGKVLTDQMKPGAVADLFNEPPTKSGSEQS